MDIKQKGLALFAKAKKAVICLYNTVLTFIKDNFYVDTTKRSRISGTVLLAVTLLFVIFRVNSFISYESASRWWILAAALIMPFIVWAVTYFNLHCKNAVFNKVFYIVLAFLMPIVSVTMTEALNGVFVYDMTYLGFFGNYMVVLLLYLIVFAISGNFKWSYLIINPIIFGFATAHCYIMEFRGTPFLPMDFSGITTAAGVANTYNFAPNFKLVIATIILIFTIIVGLKTKHPDYHLISGVITRAASFVFVVVMLTVFYATNFFANLGVVPDFWNQTRGYKNYGFVFNFFANTKYLYVTEPSNYDPQNVQKYVNEVISDNTESKPKTEIKSNNPNTPNIICIMNESLSDLQVLGDLQTNEDYMPFMRNLTENTIRGDLYVPVIGAGTSNTEFEFLTGHTTAFLPSGSNAYMLYVKHPMASLVSTLEAQGYSSFALHPYYSIGWKRTEVYHNFGFNLFKSLEDIIDIEIMHDFQENGNDPDYLQQRIEETYPGKNMLVRQYVSDSYNFKLLTEDFENRDKSVPYFAFNVTMQNHGGYTNSCVNFDENIYATNLSTAYTKANKYLSLIKKSDDAFKELIDYFSNVKEKTIICMFGDHQPSVESKFVAEVMGVNDISNLPPEQEQTRHRTPFFIWANYDIEEQTIDKLSSNYLSSLVLKTAGVELTEYNKYLLKLSETLPVIDTVGYIDSENNYYKWNANSPYSKLLDEYERIQYNTIFDNNNVDRKVFYIDDYVQPEETETEQE